MEIQNNGIMYYIPQEPNETLEMLSARGWFISKKSPTTMSEFLQYNRLSLFWANVKFLNCKYSPKIMNQLDNENIKKPKTKNNKIIKHMFK